MNKESLDLIVNQIKKTNEYWRIEITPNLYNKDRLNTIKAKTIIMNNKVSKRGWDFPHFEATDYVVDDNGNISFGLDSGFSTEFFKLFNSGQFIFLQKIQELTDWANQDSNKKMDTKFYFLANLYKLMEFNLFAHNLSVAYETTINFKIIFKCSKERKVFEDSKYHIHPHKSLQSDQIVISKNINSSDSINEINASICLEFFSYFELNVPQNLIDTEFQQFLNQR